MSLTAIKNKVTSKVGRQILVTQKHSPTLLFGVGVVGVVATIVLASRATLKMEEVLSEAEENEKKFEEIAEDHPKKYTDEDRKNDSKINKVRTAGKIVKLYAPAAAVGLVSIGAFTGSHVILSRRNAAVTAAYAALDKGFRQYRERVVSEYGPEKDQEFRFETVEKEMAVDTDEGTAVKTVKTISEKNRGSIYSRFFDESSSNWSPIKHQNQFFVQAQQNYANDLLNARGHVFLNEVYDMLGLERSPEGQVVGWVKGNGDGYIDFGVFRKGAEMFEAQRFVNGDERSVLLDFNVDGVVYNLI